jgi:predicted NBD/HSP70 family sugar kinase
MSKPPPPTTPEEVRRHNLGGVLRLLHVHGAMSRAELTVRTGLNRSTVKALASELTELGLVREWTPPGSGGAGRPSIMVAPTENVFVLAVDIGVDHLRAARVGLGGVILDREDVSDDRTAYDLQQTVKHIAAMCQKLLAAAPFDARCVGVGIAVCGLVTADTGMVRFAPNLGWIDAPLAGLLHAELGGIRALVGNEADLGALAEHVRGAGAGTSDLIYLSGEAGVGGGIITGGRPLGGADGYGGEVGHTMVNPDGAMCRCGRRGCWETEIGEDAVLRATGFEPGTSFTTVLDAYAAGDKRVARGMKSIGRWLGAGVADLVNIFNPQMVIFGGITQHLFKMAEAEVRAAVGVALVAPRERVRLAMPGLDVDSELLGAAELAFGALLRNPLAADLARLARGSR